MKACVIGSTGKGNYGHGMDVVWQAFPQIEIAAVADDDAAGLAKASGRLGGAKPYADYRQMLAAEKPDLVSICPRWPDQHRDMLVAAAEAGVLGVYMEKPMCRSLEEADAMIAAAEKHGMKAAVAHQTRYSPVVHAAKQMVEDGKIGRVLELRGRGKDDPRGGGEDLWVLGVHVFNLMHYFGGEPTWCSALVEQGGEPVTKAHVKPGNEALGPLAGDHLAAMFRLSGGAFGYFSSARAAAPRDDPSRFGITIYGSDGVIALEFGYLPRAHWLPDGSWTPGRTGKAWVPISSNGPGEPETLKIGSQLGDGNVAAVRDLLHAIADDRQPECSLYEARTTISMVSAVFESHRLGKPVGFPLENRKNPLGML
ncbi:MAG: Gfo/Idh/MocA family oxidoreductase [Verrucomicrobiales bacterium]